MALRQLRVCDVTGDLDAEPVQVAVGHTTWVIDLSAAGLKLLEEALQPFIDVAQMVTAGDGEGVSVLAAAADADPAGELTAEDRTTCRVWGRRHARRLGFTPPRGQGRLSQRVVDAWVDAGRPAA